MPPARRRRQAQRSYCEVTAQNEAEFVGARSQPPRYPIIKSPTSNALFVRARPNNPYKRYVTSTCARTPQVRNHLAALQQTQSTRFDQLTDALAQIDAQAQDARTGLPFLLNEIRNYRQNDATVAVFEELCSAVEQLDPQGQTCMYLWFIRGAANLSGKLLTGRPIWNRRNKNWNQIDANAKRLLRERVQLTLQLTRAPAVRIDPVRRFESCDNLRVAARATDLFTPDSLLQVGDFTPYADLAKLTSPPNGPSACALSENVATVGRLTNGGNGGANGGPRVVSPFRHIVHWGGSNAQRPTDVPNVVRPRYLGIDFDLPTVRCFRFAAAYRILGWPH